MRMPREPRMLLLGNMVIGGIQTGKAQEALLAEDLARALRVSNEESERAMNAGRIDRYRFYRGIGDWIRQTIDGAHDEGVFRNILENYHGPLAEQSFVDVSEAIAELPSSVVIGFHDRLPEILETIPRMASPQGEMFAAGQFLAAGLRQLYLPMLSYGSRVGLFRPEDFGVEAPELRAFAPGEVPPSADYVLVDVEHLEMLRVFEGVMDRVARDWGQIHPLVQGGLTVFRKSDWLDESGANRLRPVADEIEQYLRSPRH